MVVPGSGSDYVAAPAASDAACFLFDLAGAASSERTALVSALRDVLQRAGTTVVVNSHDVAAMLHRAWGVQLANAFDSQVGLSVAFCLPSSTRHVWGALSLWTT